jgi:hypothetical protein
MTSIYLMWSIDVAVASGVVYWPVFVAVCRGPIAGFQNNCKMAMIVSPDGAGSDEFHEGPNMASVRASVSTKHVAGTQQFVAQLDYCNGKQPADAALANEQATKAPIDQRRQHLANGVRGVQKRLRRDLVSY